MSTTTNTLMEFLCDVSPLATTVYELSGQCIYANEAAASLVGATCDQLLNQNFLELQSWQNTGLKQCALLAIERQEERSLTIETTSTFGKKVYLGCVFRPLELEKRPLLVMNYADVFLHPATTDSNKEILSRSIAHAMFRNSAAEKFLTEKAFSEQILDLVPETVCVFDSKTNRPLRWNRTLETISGYSAEEIADGKSALSFVRNAEGDDWQSLLRKVYQGKSATIETIATTKSGEKIPIEFSARMSFDEAGTPEYFVLVGRDLRERKNLERQLVHAQRMESIGQLAAGIAHEINTPTQYVGDNTRFLKDAFADLLTVLNQSKKLVAAVKEAGGFEELLVAQGEIEEEADLEYLMDEIPGAIGQTLEGVDRVAKIVLAMKEFSHPGSDKKSPADINAALKTTVTVAGNEWKYVADTDLQLDPALPPVPCLLGDLNQVFLNIIVNAAHAISARKETTGSRDKGIITISTHVQKNCVEIRFEDNGSGMTEDVKNSVFNPFFTTKPVGKGTGQGLAIAHSVVVDKHDGTLEVESEVNRGSAFIIRLPLPEDSTSDYDT